MRLHTGEKTYKCDQCDKVFSYRNSLDKHKKIHTSLRQKKEIFNCEFCDKSFSSQSNLNSHKLFHEIMQKFSCGECEKTFVDLSSLKSHEKLQHGTSTEYTNTTEFIDCGETIKTEIKQEIDLNLVDPLSVESELEAESSDCKETIKLEIKQEIQETEDL